METLLWKLNGVHEAESVRLALYSARQSMLAESASDESLDKKEIEKWKRDSKLLEAIQDGCWDVRFLSSSNGDAGDYNIGIEIVAHFMEKPQERVIGEDWNENLRTALEQAMTAEAYPPARPAPTSHPIPTGATGEEQDRSGMSPYCPECDGGGRISVLSDNSPDAHDVDIDCTHCDGSGSAADAAKNLARALQSERMQHLQIYGEYKNFHRSLCARFGYGHDQVHFRRDLVSLEEAIAAKVSAPAAGDALDAASLLNIRFTPVSEGLPDLVEYSPSYAGQWSSKWCAVITARGNIEASQLVLPSSDKEALEAARFNGAWRSGMDPSRVVAWAYMDHIRSAAEAAAIAQQSQRKEA
ncbi:hypothetical protein [Achromobacter spanius]|uniref:hypothetical protein n=1 Tax=Achromobacter spanius TaxID=217203 RepID=UPI0018DEAE3A|nr:hypothetical protein [Achromobacter spanius]